MATFNISARIEHHLTELLKLPSMSNRTEATTEYVVNYAKKQGYNPEVAVDNSVRVRVKGKDKKRVVAYVGHLDRIGLMVDELCDDGTVKISAVGGLYPRHVEEQIAAIHTDEGNVLEGLIYHEDTPIHKMGVDKFAKRESKWEKMRFRPDACIAHADKKQLDKLGVEVGNLVFLPSELRIDKKYGGYRSRWLDNTLGCAVLLTLMDKWRAEKVMPIHTADLLFSVAEETGMGGSTVWTQDITDFIAVDTTMGEAKGVDMAVPSIKQKAGRFPYSKVLIDEFIAAAKQAKVGYNRQCLSGGGTDAEQARLSGFPGRVLSVVVPLKNLHSIEACTSSAVEALVKMIDAHATAKPAAAKKKPAKKKA